MFDVRKMDGDHRLNMVVKLPVQYLCYRVCQSIGRNNLDKNESTEWVCYRSIDAAAGGGGDDDDGDASAFQISACAWSPAMLPQKAI